VFTAREGVFGFVTTPRVVIGQENIVLCHSSIEGKVRAYASTTNAKELVEVVGPGIPSDWKCLRGYYPQRPSSTEPSEEVLLALNPRPDAALMLTGGLSLSRSEWLIGYPPAIHVVGALPDGIAVTIDSAPAAQGDSGSWIANGWDDPGRHTVQFGGLTRSYELVAGKESWNEWPAHIERTGTVCGALVQGTACRRPTVLEQSAWLLGCEPGQVLFAHGCTAAYPEFEPIWAVRSVQSKRKARSYLLAKSVSPRERATLDPSAIREWCQLVRSSAAAESSSRSLWREYAAFARKLRRRRR
jgi:hypothetical protein